GEHRGPRFTLGSACGSWGSELRALRDVLQSWGMTDAYVYDLRAVRALAKCPPSPCRFGASIFRRAAPRIRASGIVTATTTDHVTLDLGDYTGRLTAAGVVWTGQPLAVVAPLGAVLDVELPESLSPPGGTIPVTLIPRPFVEGAVVALDPTTREVRALIGGVDFHRGDRNRARFARREIGSTIKPFVFAAAIQHGVWTPDQDIHDVPIAYTDPWTGVQWIPSNWYPGHVGTLSVTDALTRSVNLAAVEATLTFGVSATASFLEDLGIPRPVPANPALALGTIELAPIDLANLYAVFADAGRAGTPVLTPTDAPWTEQVLDPALVATMNDLLRFPVDRA
ncbi:MAG: penicillin-binding transpeptidase domain-containing protein, partial [bacterium]|nr:penicillin-binding transpeptidase domain-containing protein [bacterium]